MDGIVPNKFIITGAASAGKTTLVNALGERGFNYQEEISRKIIRQQLKLSSSALPWQDMHAFCALTFDAMIEAHKKVPGSSICFFDRAIPDIIANLDSCKLTVPQSYTNAVIAAGYNQNVFILPIQPSIYVNDNERRETYDQAKKIYQSVIKVYQSLGFILHEIPLMSLEQRVEMILNKINTFSYDIA